MVKYLYTNSNTLSLLCFFFFRVQSSLVLQVRDVHRGTRVQHVQYRFTFILVSFRGTLGA